MTGTVAADGTAELSLRTLARQTWTVRQVSVNAPNVGGGATCGLYLNGALITPMVPQAGAAVEPPPVTLQPGSILEVRWTAGTVGARVEATYIYDDQ
jgi:hypothetical protein